jgi:hypothetical protein
MNKIEYVKVDMDSKAFLGSCGGHGNVSMYSVGAFVKLESGWIRLLALYSIGYYDQHEYTGLHGVVNLYDLDISVKDGCESEELQKALYSRYPVVEANQLYNRIDDLVGKEIFTQLWKDLSFRNAWPECDPAKMFDYVKEE